MPWKKSTKQKAPAVVFACQSREETIDAIKKLGDGFLSTRAFFDFFENDDAPFHGVLIKW